jgi:cytochrome c1
MRRSASSDGTTARAVTIALVLLGLTACSNRREAERIASELTGGEPARGAQQIRNYGCDGCHTIPGVRTADATVGPPLTRIALRSYLAGRIENTPENMIRWIREPLSVDDKTAMPNTGVTERDARDIAAYLYTLR